MKLGKREIDALTCPPGRRDMIVFDDSLPGFGLRVTAAGTKTFLFQGQLGGRAGHRVRIVLGVYGVSLTPAEARLQAREVKQQLQRGEDPAAAKRAAAVEALRQKAEKKRLEQEATFTLAKLLSAWADQGLASASNAHRQEAPRAIRHAFERNLERPAAVLTAKDVQLRLDEIARNRPVSARRTRDYGRAAFNWACGRGLVGNNPFLSAQIDVREISRDRVLSDVELKEAWIAAKEMGHPFGSLIQLLLLTLQRRGEVAGMRWSELATDFSVWTIPATRAKNRKEHQVHLSRTAARILQRLPRSKTSDLVFTTDGRTAVSGFSKAHRELLKRVLDQRAKDSGGSLTPKPPNWRWHDFRRTGVTVLARKGVSVHVADRLLNHITGAMKGTMAVYQRHEFLVERKQAIRIWTAHILRAARTRPRN